MRNGPAPRAFLRKSLAARTAKDVRRVAPAVSPAPGRARLAWRDGAGSIVCDFPTGRVA